MITVRIPVGALVHIDRPFQNGSWFLECLLCGHYDREITKDAATEKAVEHLFEEHKAYARETES